MLFDDHSPGFAGDQGFPSEHRSGFVAVIGKPNVGKSTLLNRLLGEKLAIVSAKPQTTRSRQLGILSGENYQIVFVDTPGIHQARNLLGDYMVNQASEAVIDADVIIFVTDVASPVDKGDIFISELVGQYPEIPVIHVLNKTDLLQDPEDLDASQAAHSALVQRADPYPCSALNDRTLDSLLERIIVLLPYGPRYFPEDQLTDSWERDTAAEIIREKILEGYTEEIPHAVAVVVEEYKERQNATYIRAIIYVEKDSQKRIIIGKNGRKLKEIGVQARLDMEQQVGESVYLDLWVKVMKEWRRDSTALRRLGYLVKS